MHQARYWCYFDGVASTALALINATDLGSPPPVIIPEGDEIGFVVGFNPPQPIVIPVISTSVATAVSHLGSAAAFHVQAQRRLLTQFAVTSLPETKWVAFINLFDLIHGNPRQCRKLLRESHAFPCWDKRTVADKLSWAISELHLTADQIKWVCCAWGMNGCRDNDVLRQAQASVDALRVFPTVARTKFFGFATKGLASTHARHALDCAHIGDSKKFLAKKPDWVL